MFHHQLSASGLYPLKPSRIETLQLNVGKLCNQRCAHCHVGAGPDRKEIMTRETMEHCLNALDSSTIKTVDLTGGAPEMNPNFRWLVEEIRKRGCKVIVRCNLTILMAHSYHDMPDFFAKHSVHVVSSLPCYSKDNVDDQRGDGVYEKSIRALMKLNAVGYGEKLPLDLVYNPVGAFLPPPQPKLEKDYKRALFDHHGIRFNRLLTITNMPISRFRDFLEESHCLESYMDKLVTAYNVDAAKNVMCRTMLSVSWDGYLYDCDFNQMLEMKIKGAHVSTLDWDVLRKRDILVGEHCFGCTAGTGSSCGGQLV